MNDRATRSEPRLGRANQNSSTLLASDDGVGGRGTQGFDLGGRQGQPAPLAGTTVQRCGTQPTMIRSDLVVEREEVSRNTLREPCPICVDDALLVGDIGEEVGHAGGNGVPFADQGVAIPRELGHGRSCTLHSLHDLELDILEIRLTAGQVLQLRLDRLQLLGIADRTRVEQVLVSGATLAHLLDIAIRTLLLILQIAGDRLSSHDLIANALQTGVQIGKSDRFRQVRSTVGELRETGVALLDFEENQLDGGVGVQDVLPR